MNTSGDAAEQVVRLSLEGVEVAAKITGSAAKEVSALLIAALKNRDRNKVKGRQRLTAMLRSGKELTIFTVKNQDMARFVADAKRYGVVYCVLREAKDNPSYVLSGNTAEMRRIRQRIEEVSRTQSTEYVGWDFPGGRAEADKEDNRLRLYFDEKPSEEQRSKLKCNGFKWAPSVGAWQRQLNDNAIHAAARMDFLRPESGESPTAIQPKRPAKNAPERG